MISIFVGLCCLIFLSFVAGWVVGKYGHDSVPEPEGQLLIASELARVNRKEWR